MRTRNVAADQEPAVAGLLNESEAGLKFESSQVSPGQDDAMLLDEYSRTIVSAANRVGPAVVNIDIKQRLDSRRGPRELARRPGSDRNREPPWFSGERDRGRDQCARPVDARAIRPFDRQYYSNRCRSEPGKLRRAAGKLSRRSDRRKHGDDSSGPGNLFRDREQHREICRRLAN